MGKSLAKSTIIPKAIHKKGLTRSFVYSGQSMQPTFRTGQLLYVRPDVQNVKPGDIVVYEQGGRFIVHRVLSIGMDGYITRGDNNPLIDAYPVAPNQVIGRVEMGEQRGEINSVISGWQGLWMARIGRPVRRVKQWLRIILSWPYYLLKVSRILGWVWKPKVLCINLQLDNGLLIKYIYRKKTVAVWDASSNCFECHKPFDLVIFHPRN